MLNQPKAVLKCYFRPALPHDRRQIRLLLCSYHHQTTNSARTRWLGSCFGLGLGLALVLHGLAAIGGIQLLVYGMLGLGSVALAGWLNLWLFADWQDYWVIEQNQQLIACAKRTSYGSYALLADLVVAPAYRHRGVGTLLVESITKLETQPLYLACRPELLLFYQRFQFVVINPGLLTAYLRRELGVEQNPALMVLRRPVNEKESK